MADVLAATSLVPDGDLAGAVRAGDIGAFTVLVDRYHPSFHSVRLVGSEQYQTSIHGPPRILIRSPGVRSVDMEESHGQTIIAYGRRLHPSRFVRPRAPARVAIRMRLGVQYCLALHRASDL